MYTAGFSPDVRNFGGRNIIVDGLVAHTMNLYRIHHRTPDVLRRRQTSSTKQTRKSHSRSKNSESKKTIRKSREHTKSPDCRPKGSNRRPIYTHSNCITKSSYNDLDLGVIQRDYSNAELLEALKQVEMSGSEKSNRRIFKRLINHVVKHRIIKDQQFDQLFIDLVNAYPTHEELLRNILVEVVSALDF